MNDMVGARAARAAHDDADRRPCAGAVNREQFGFAETAGGRRGSCEFEQNLTAIFCFRFVTSL
jgi:hypothetical protein